MTQKILELPGYQFERHVMFMLIGIIRAIPIVGSFYSQGVLTGQIKVNPVLDDPRWPESDPRHYIKV